eukprot:1425295-Amphidinium_carterae.1
MLRITSYKNKKSGTTPDASCTTTHQGLELQESIWSPRVRLRCKEYLNTTACGHYNSSRSAELVASSLAISL